MLDEVESSSMFSGLFDLVNHVMETIFPMSEIRTELNITDEQVAERAHELFVDRGYEHGNDVQDWLEAEAQLVDEAVAASVDELQELIDEEGV